MWHIVVFMFQLSFHPVCALPAAGIGDLVHSLQKLLCDHITSVMSDREGSQDDILGVDHGQCWQLKGESVRTVSWFSHLWTNRAKLAAPVLDAAQGSVCALSGHSL